MHVAINGMFWGQPTVGSGPYLHGLLDALARVAPEHSYTLLLPAFQNDQRPTTNDQRDSKPSSFVARPSFVAVRTPFDGRSANLAKLWFEQISVPWAAARLGADLLHVPYFAPPLISRVPVVATILDIIPLLLPEYRGSAAVRAYMRLVTLAARRVRHTIAISEHSRRDIMTHLQIPPDRVTTVPLAAGPQYLPADRHHAAACVAERYGLREPFVYYVGGLDARKNVGTLVRAFARMRRAGGPPTTLAIAGRALGGDPRLFPDLDALIAEEQAEPWVRRIDVPHADGPLLYQAATVFAYPSRYEGFGLPPLEALACGTPAVVAEASSLPEAVGDAALRVPPDDVPGWTVALWRLLADTQLRAELRARGLQQAARFGYDRAAQATAEIFRASLLPRP
ncbi:MAG TPA: glycosyltransferase family 1 protein [Roseiflexaceae bacterium]|nr:glycosyltransferase family 1 protein [Roseiflexaceae bacterium]